MSYFVNIYCRIVGSNTAFLLFFCWTSSLGNVPGVCLSLSFRKCVTHVYNTVRLQYYLGILMLQQCNPTSVLMIAK